MNLVPILLVFLLAIIIVLFMVLRKQREKIQILEQEHEELKFSHKSTLVKHGKSFEQLFPYMANYPYNPAHFRFIGSPIDGLSFEDDKVVFVEFKTGQSRLSKKQQAIKDLILKKKVSWKEIRG